MRPCRPTDDLIDTLSDLIGRVMDETGKTRVEACDYLKNHFKELPNND